MSKKLVIAIIISALFCVTIILGCFFIHPRSNQPTVIIKDLCFGMSPSDIETLLGEPNDAEDSILSSGVKVYYYDTQIDGIETELWLRFVRVGLRRQLYQVDAKIRVTENSSDILSELRQQIYDVYSVQEGFFYSNEAMGVRSGAYGTNFSIKQTETHVSLSGYCDEYEKLFFE